MILQKRQYHTCIAIIQSTIDTEQLVTLLASHTNWLGCMEFTVLDCKEIRFSSINVNADNIVIISEELLMELKKDRNS